MSSSYKATKHLQNLLRLDYEETHSSPTERWAWGHHKWATYDTMKVISITVKYFSSLQLE